MVNRFRSRAKDTLRGALSSSLKLTLVSTLLCIANHKNNLFFKEILSDQTVPEREKQIPPEFKNL
jgi:hypothetical protein